MVSFKVRVAEKNFELDVRQDKTIWEAKVVLQESNPESGLLANFSRWVFKGKVLGDSTTIAICGLSDGDCVIAVKTKTASSERFPGGEATIGATPSTPVRGASPAAGNGTGDTSLQATPVSRVPSAFDAAMHELLAHNEDATQVKACVTTLARICANVIQHPMEPKYRRVPAANKSFETKVGSLRGGNAAMTALGFSVAAEGESRDWVLVPSAAAWEVMTACYDKLLNFQARLAEALPASASAPTSLTPASPAPEAAAAAGEKANGSASAEEVGAEMADGQVAADEAARLMLAALALAASSPDSPTKAAQEQEPEEAAAEAGAATSAVKE